MVGQPAEACRGQRGVVIQWDGWSRGLERFARGARLSVIGGAMWRRRLFSHLTIDRELPGLCTWSVGRLLLTQIGRTAPPHEQLERAVRRLCPKAAPAWDGMVVELDRLRS